jgi:hypothetical protein
MRATSLDAIAGDTHVPPRCTADAGNEIGRRDVFQEIRLGAGHECPLDVIVRIERGEDDEQGVGVLASSMSGAR